MATTADYPNLEEHVKVTEDHLDYIIPQGKSLNYRLEMVSQFILGYMIGKTEFSYPPSPNYFIVSIPDVKYKKIMLVVPANESEREELQKRADSHFG